MEKKLSVRQAERAILEKRYERLQDFVKWVGFSKYSEAVKELPLEEAIETLEGFLDEKDISHKILSKRRAKIAKQKFKVKNKQEKKFNEESITSTRLRRRKKVNYNLEQYKIKLSSSEEDNEEKKEKNKA
eukprot:Anaeramoba_flamelloidesa5579_13.p1 GENE.a5579_13~~a5579_13.p1  ORF type:complete len:130 (-),score=48.13 a5579_13:85-474(-)